MFRSFGAPRHGEDVAALGFGGASVWSAQLGSLPLGTSTTCSGFWVLCPSGSSPQRRGWHVTPHLSEVSIGPHMRPGSPCHGSSLGATTIFEEWQRWGYGARFPSSPTTMDDRHADGEVSRSGSPSFPMRTICPVSPTSNESHGQWCPMMRRAWLPHRSRVAART